MPHKPTDLLDIADLICTAQNFSELVHLAHARPEDAPTVTAAAHVSGLLQTALDILSRITNPTPQEATK